MRKTQKESNLHCATRQANPMERREALVFAESANAEFAAETGRTDNVEIRTGKRLTPGGRG